MLLGLSTRMRVTRQRQDGSMKRNFERPVLHLSALLLLSGLVLASCGGSTTPTTTTVPVLHSQPHDAVWPYFNDGVRYITARAVALGFAQTYIGMSSPTTENVTSVGATAGTVTVRPYVGGPVTSVKVYEDVSRKTWWVSGSTTADIRVSEPQPGSVVHSPLHTAGTSTAFEAVVNVHVRADGLSTPLVSSVVMGGSNGVMGNFTKDFAFDTTTSAAGAVVFSVRSAKDGSVIEATVVRLHW